MAFNRAPLRDPRTVARDIPGVLDVLFPRLSSGLVNSLNRRMMVFEGIHAVSEDLIKQTGLQKAMLFEIAMARAEQLLADGSMADWDRCLQVAASRQRRHFDANVPQRLTQCDMDVAEHAANNLVTMLKSVDAQNLSHGLHAAPLIPGLGWIASGHGDFAVGPLLIEVKHTERNFGSNDLRQVLMYLLLKYSKSIEGEEESWNDVMLLNPRRNCALLLNFDSLVRMASENLGRIELLELLRSMVCRELDRR